MAKAISSHMGVGRGRFRKALRAVLLAQHATPELESLVRKELDWLCIHCGISGEQERLQLDHLWPESQGGCLVLGNVAPACPTCNSDRRQVPWQEFLRTSARARRLRGDDDILAQTKQIEEYMRRHGQHEPPSLQTMLTDVELTLLSDFDLLLSALSDGAMARAGYQKKASIVFESPGELFNKLVAVARQHQRPPTT